MFFPVLSRIRISSRYLVIAAQTVGLFVLWKKYYLLLEINEFKRRTNGQFTWKYFPLGCFQMPNRLRILVAWTSNIAIFFKKNKGPIEEPLGTPVFSVHTGKDSSFQLSKCRGFQGDTATHYFYLQHNQI